MNGLSNRAHVGRRIVAAAVLCTCVSVPRADEPVWLKLQAERFGVISQLDEAGTRRWAVEFDQFVDALLQLYAIDDGALPPLTMVLFEQPRDFAPYQVQTESGQVRVAGFFANMGTWSVIGLAGRRSSPETRRIVYHEGVHWFMSAMDTEVPLWFNEGLAEVFSTFEVEDGQARWGMTLQNHIDYLGYYPLRPLDEFLRVSQDQALHGSGGYYPQAWAFTHFFLFGNSGAERSKLAEFVKQLQQTDIDTAFATAFETSYEELTDDLRSYLRRGRYGIQLLDARDRGGEMAIEPASAAVVEFALARLAAGGGNDELARKHLDTVRALAPRAAPAFELLALLAQRSGDEAALAEALDKAIELGSGDAEVYSAKAYQSLEENRHDGPIDDMLPADTARNIADLFGRSIALRPLSRRAYEGFAVALLNVDTVTEQDDTALALGRRAVPTDAFVLVGQAAVARRRGNVPEATALLRRSQAPPFELPTRHRSVVAGLHDAWLAEWIGGRVQELVAADRFAEARALLDEQLADVSITNRSRANLERMQAGVSVMERFHAADEAARNGRWEESTAILRELASDPNLPPRVRADVQRRLDLEEGE